jgi:hypothetical protein
MLPTTDPLKTMEDQCYPQQTHRTQDDGASNPLKRNGGSKFPTMDPQDHGGSKLATTDPLNSRPWNIKVAHYGQWRIEVAHCRLTQDHGGSMLPTTNQLKTMDDRSCPLQTHSRPWRINVAHYRPTQLKTMEDQSFPLQTHSTQDDGLSMLPTTDRPTQDNGGSNLPTTDPLYTVDDQCCPLQTHSRQWRINVAH